MSALTVRFDEGAAYLRDRGLNLLGVLDVAALPAAVREPLAAAGLELAGYPCLVVIGHAGRRLWAELNRTPFNSPDPVDDYSRQHTAHFAQQYLGDTGWRLLYPSEVFFPLNLLGELVGWGRPSPLGLGMHPEYGLWWAYRTVFLSQLPLPVTVPVATPHPCDSCVGQPCLAACPAGALSPTAGFDVYACSDYRVSAGSSCAAQCLARQACPVGAQHRYTPDQINYHYRLSLATIKAYKAGEG